MIRSRVALPLPVAGSDCESEGLARLRSPGRLDQQVHCIVVHWTPKSILDRGGRVPTSTPAADTQRAARWDHRGDSRTDRRAIEAGVRGDRSLGAAPGLAVGDRAPDFTLPDALGRPVSLADLLADGPAVVTFYRGEWCPYCNLQLHALQAALPAIRTRGVASSRSAPKRAITASRSPRSTRLPSPS